MFSRAPSGFRCLGHDRRCHGRSSQPFNGQDMDTYAADLHELVTSLDLGPAIHVGHSTGGGEVARYIRNYGTKRVAKAVLVAAVPPLMLKTPANPAGTPISLFDGLRASVPAARSRLQNPEHDGSASPAADAGNSPSVANVHCAPPIDAWAVVYARSSSHRAPAPLIASFFPQLSPPRLLTSAAFAVVWAPRWLGIGGAAGGGGGVWLFPGGFGGGLGVGAGPQRWGGGGEMGDSLPCGEGGGGAAAGTAGR